MADRKPAWPDRRECVESLGPAGGLDGKTLDDAPAAAQAPGGYSAEEIGLIAAFLRLSIDAQGCYVDVPRIGVKRHRAPSVRRDSDVAETRRSRAIQSARPSPRKGVRHACAEPSAR